MTIFELSWITYLLTGVLLFVILFFYFKSFFDMKYGTKITIGVYGLLFCANTLSFFLFESEPINIVFSIIMFSILTMLYRGNLKNRIVIMVFIYIASFLADFFVAFFIAYITNSPTENIAFGTPEFLYGLLFSRTLLAVFAKIISVLWRWRVLPTIKTTHMIVLIAPPAGSVFVLYDFIHHRIYSTAAIISAMIVVTINFTIFIVYNKILADYEADIRSRQLEEQLKSYDYQNFLTTESEKLVNKTKHDLNNLLIGVKSDIHMSDFESVEKRISELLGDICIFDGPAQSGNIPIDAIINYKWNQASRHNIHFSLDLIIPEVLDFDSTSLCRIIGNALDNAIEATKAVAGEFERTISIHISYIQGALFIQVKNPHTGAVITDRRGVILSSKRAFRSEGIGIQSIKAAVKRYDGAVFHTCEKGEFCMSITLYG